EAYRKGAFGPNYASFYQAFNPSTLDLSISFPAAHNLYMAKVNDIEDIKPYWGGSKFIKFNSEQVNSTLLLSRIPDIMGGFPSPVFLPFEDIEVFGCAD